MKDKSERFWNKLSTNYDKKAKDQTFEQLLNRSPKYLQRDDVVLDFACATGLYSFEFARHVKEIQAFDSSSEMIVIAKDQANKNGNANITFSHTTLFDKKYQEGSFDTIMAFNILLYFEDTEKILNRMNKLLKPKGLIITSTACLGEKRTFIGIVSGSVIFILKKLGILPYLKFYKIPELKEVIANCGFKSIESDILIEKPAIEYFIVAQKSDARI